MNILPLDADNQSPKHHSEIKHNEFVVRVRKRYESEDEDCYYPNQGEGLTCIPDLIVEDSLALEMKVEYNDMMKSLFQCRFYYIEGYSPYLFIPESLYEENKTTVDKLYYRLPENTPGLVVVSNYRMNTVHEPNYCDMS